VLQYALIATYDFFTNLSDFPPKKDFTPLNKFLPPSASLFPRFDAKFLPFYTKLASQTHGFLDSLY